MEDCERDDDQAAADNHLEACFLLHCNAATKKRGNKSKERSGIEMPPCVEDEPDECRKWRLQAFESVWNDIEKLAEDTLEEMNVASFKELEHWINNSKFCKAQLDLYRNSSAVVKRLSTALMFSGSVDSSDCVLDSLSTYLKKQNRCRVAQLQPHDFLHGVNGPLRSLFKQFMNFTPETTDMEILAAWHRDNELPLVVIVEDTERCNSSTLAELLVILSEWTSEIPFILVLGMATTQDSLSTLFPSSVMGRLQLRSFVLKPPLDRLEAVIRKALIESPHIFFLEHNVVKLAYDYFFTHDNSVTSFLRILKISCMEHFCKQPLSFLCEKLSKLTTRDDFEELCSKLPPPLLEYVAKLSSASETILMAEALWNYKTGKQLWSMGLQCLEAAGSRLGFTFHDVFCGAMNPCLMHEGDHTLAQIIDKTRRLSKAMITETLEDWMLMASDDNASCKILKALQQQLEDAKVAPSSPSPRKTLPCSPSKMTRRTRALIGPNSPTSKKTSDKAAMDSNIWKSTVVEFLERMQSHVTAIYTMPYRDIFCFKDAIMLKKALTGDTRRNVHLDLISSQTMLGCKCCPSDGSLASSVHDTSLAYVLSQEHNELINVHDWYQSFETISCPPSQQASTTKRSLKRKMSFDSEDKADKAVAQARFSKAVAELHLAGLVRLPKKRNPDFLQKVVLG